MNVDRWTRILRANGKRWRMGSIETDLETVNTAGQYIFKKRLIRGLLRV